VLVDETALHFLVHQLRSFGGFICGGGILGGGSIRSAHTSEAEAEARRECRAGLERAPAGDAG
jgi:hypothetical protein